MLFSRSCSASVSSTRAQELLALDAAGLDGCRDLLVADRIGIAEGQILQFAAHLAHAQAVSQRRVNVQRLAGDGLAALRLQMLQGAHIVQPVGQLDQHHAHVGDHGQQHLAHVLRLPVLAIGEFNLVDVGDAFDDARHLVAKAGCNLFIGGGRVFDRIVQEAGGDGGRVHAHIRQDLGHLQRMDDIRLTGGPHLALHGGGRRTPRPCESGRCRRWGGWRGPGEEALQCARRWAFPSASGQRSTPPRRQERARRKPLPVRTAGQSP